MIEIHNQYDPEALQTFIMSHLILLYYYSYTELYCCTVTVLDTAYCTILYYAVQLYFTAVENLCIYTCMILKTFSYFSSRYSNCKRARKSERERIYLYYAVALWLQYINRGFLDHDGCQMETVNA